MGNAHKIPAVRNRRTDTGARARGQDRIGKAAFNALSFFAAALLLAVAVSTAPAHATDQAVSLSVGARIPYAGYSTNWMYADGQMAYCATPSKKTPAAGTYTASALASPSNRDYEATADLWFSFGCPGFDKTLWPDTWYDGSAMTDDRYVALAHILISDSYASDGNAALYGCSSSFRSWARMNVIGFDENANEINPNATGRRILARAGDVPSSFEAFEIRTGSATQAVIGFRYTPSGSIELSKTISVPQISANNPLYTNEGAVYGVFRDEGCTERACELITNSDGYARVDDIACGSYWIQETKAPANASLDGRVYPVEVTDRKTTRVNSAEGGIVCDEPLFGAIDLLISKRDAETGSGAAQGSASLAGAEFTVRYFTNLDANTSGSPKYTWRFKTDSEGAVRLGSAQQAQAAYIGGDALVLDDNGKPIFPVGTYVLVEEQAPRGYLINDEPTTFVLGGSDTAHTAATIYPIRHDAPMNLDIPFAEQVVRNDLQLMKKAHDTNASLSVPFLITSTSTGEAHVLVCDRNGNASTASSWNPHSRNTNANDKLTSFETISSDDMDSTAGIWFGLDDSGGYAPVRDDLSALPFGEYRLEELRCDANAGFDLINKSFWVERDSSLAQAIWMSLSDHTADIDEPEEPEQPDDPSDPEDPNEPEDPDKSEQPDKPDDPQDPDKPDEPNQPENPGESNDDSPDDKQKRDAASEKKSNSTDSGSSAAPSGKLAQTGDPLLAPSLAFFALAASAAIVSALYAKHAYGLCLKRRKKSYLRYRS